MQCACALLDCPPLWPVRLYHIFQHHLIKVTIFGKTLLHIKCVFWFSLELLSETFLILRRIEWDIMINVHHTRHQLDLDRPVSVRLIVSSPVFQVTFGHSVYNLAPSWCCSCLLHVAANSI
jgi:hypothetical protein